MQGTTQPIDRQTLLEKANKLIREHEDTLAGIEATDVVQRNNVRCLAVSFTLMSRDYRRRRVQRYLTCLSILLTSCRTSTTWSIKTGENNNARPRPRVMLFTSAVSDRAATSAAEADRRSPPRYR